MTPDTLATVELLVKDSVANELKQNGLAEIALRRVDQKFRSFVKCRVIDNAGTETAVKIMDSVLTLVKILCKMLECLLEHITREKKI